MKPVDEGAAAVGSNDTAATTKESLGDGELEDNSDNHSKGGSKGGQQQELTKENNSESKDGGTPAVGGRRGRGRPPKKWAIEEQTSNQDSPVVVDGNQLNDNSQSVCEAIDSTDETEVAIAVTSQKRRGRKRKEKPDPATAAADKYIPDPKKRGIMAGSDAPLRRRDRITPTARYSPPPHQPSRRGGRGRGSGGSMSFPSTSSSRYISYDSDEETRKQGKASDSYVLDFKKDQSSNKMLITVSDGTTYKVDATPVPLSSRGTKRRGDEDEDFDIADDGAVEDNEDDEYKPTYNERRKLKQKTREEGPSATPKTPLKTPSRQAKAKKPIWKPQPISTNCEVSHAGTSTNQSKICLDPVKTNTNGTRMTKITTGTLSGKTKVTIITTPKSVTLTPAFNKPPKRSYGAGAAKFLDELPELAECTDDICPGMSRLPDRVLFLNADLPIKYEIMNQSSKIYAFRQLLSPVVSSFPCLLCSQANPSFTFKSEKDLIHHYANQHEFNIERTHARFSEEVVYVCLPKSSIEIITDNKGSEVVLNTPCQYCEGVLLSTVDDLVPHYVESHAKTVEFIEQEAIMSMHKFLYCCVCMEQFSEFKSLHSHCKVAHQLHTYSCKSCTFLTQDATRLKTHYKAKHMVNSSMQNLQCNYCNGIVLGPERMNKHIMTNHCIQTAPNEYSCTNCLSVCGKADQLLAHSHRCPALPPREKCSPLTKQSKDQEKVIVSAAESSGDNASTGEAADLALTAIEIVPETTDVGQQYDTAEVAGVDGKVVAVDPVSTVPTTCFLCAVTFESEEKCELHLSHVHAKWLTRSSTEVHDTFLMIRQPSGETKLLPKSLGASASNPDGKITLADLPSQAVLEEIGVKAAHGHYCIKCESVIQVYQLHYLHMYNVHKMEKMFQCKITSCKQTFRTSRQLSDHMVATEHPQKSVIEDTMGAISCHFCDVHFADKKEFENHQMTEEHYIKFQTADKHQQRPEPKNYKCTTCHTWFGLKDSFIYHMENETHKHGCPYCGLHFALPSSRRIHIQSHHAEQQDICEICSSKQGSKERLVAHLVEHDIVFECNTCMKKFYQREQLNAHMDVHGEPVDCPWQGCTKRIGLGVLSTHIRQHRIEMNSKCLVCNKVFANQLLLVSHMDVHAKADSNAKAILNSMAIDKGKSQSSKGDAGTTLISITTPKVPTPGSLMSAVAKTRTANNRSPRSKSNKISTTPMKTEIPEGLRILCCNCKQHFNSQPELYSHKCNVPLNETNGMQDKPKIETSLTATIIPAHVDGGGENSALEHDPGSFAHNLATQLSQAVPAEELVGSHTNSGDDSLVAVKDKAAFVRKKGSRTLLPKKNAPAKPQEQSSLIMPSDQLHILSAGDVTASAPSTDSQTLVLQQADGQMIEITIPAGVDMNEVIMNLCDGATLSTDQVVMEGSEAINLIGETQQSNSELHPGMETTTVEGNDHGQEMVDTHGPDGGDQVIYIPVNEDGTYALDPEALALLTGGSGDHVPLVGSSS